MSFFIGVRRERFSRYHFPFSTKLELMEKVWNGNTKESIECDETCRKFEGLL